MSTLAERLRQAIGDLTQAQVADTAGVAPRTVARVLAGEPARRTTLVRLARVLNVNEAWLISGEGEMRSALSAPKASADIVFIGTMDRVAGLVFDSQHFENAQKFNIGLPEAYRARSSAAGGLHQRICTVHDIALARLLEAEFGIRIEPGAERWWHTISDIVSVVESIMRFEVECGRPIKRSSSET